MRKKIIAANWKMHMTQSESEAFITTFLREIGDLDEVEIVIVPPFTSIPKVTELLTQTQNIKVGAQNMHWERSGAFTGEISPAMLRELFVRYVVLGHSERRAMFGETDEIVNRKVRAALRGSVAADSLRRRNARAARERRGRESSLVAIARQPRQRRGEGIARDGDRLRTGLGHRHGQDRDRRSRRRKRTPLFARRCAKCRMTRPRRRSAFNTAAA